MQRTQACYRDHLLVRSFIGSILQVRLLWLAASIWLVGSIGFFESFGLESLGLGSFGSQSTVFAEDPPKAMKGDSADLVIQNVLVRQCNARFDSSDAVAVKKGVVVAVGSRDVEGWISPETKVIDGKGATITPGLIDSHLHFVGLGKSLQMLDLSQAANWNQVVDQVVEAAKKTPSGTWIEGRGWHQSKWDQPPYGAVDGYPHHERLSQLVPNHPVLLTHASGHACFANAMAMKLANVNRETKNPDGGEILRDEDGLPCGVFRENAQSLVRQAMSRPQDGQTGDSNAIREQRLKQVQLAGDECLRYGITSVHDAGSSFELASQMAEWAKEGKLPLRIYMMIRTSRDRLVALMPKAKRLGVGGGFFTVRSVKVSIDGALGPHGAWLIDPYHDLPSTSGLNTVAIEELKEIAVLCKTHRWQLCVHAIGDRANREVLDVYESHWGKETATDHRWRIEHAQHLHPDDIPRFGALGVIPAMQANHCTSDAVFVPTRLGERRSRQGAYVWRSLIDSGAIIPNGTDAPVERVDPRASLYASVTRKLDQQTQFFPGQCMTREEALLSYTLWPAIASFQESEVGSIEVGKRADFVLWNCDLLTCPPEQILDAQVKATFLEGKKVYEAIDPAETAIDPAKNSPVNGSINQGK